MSAEIASSISAYLQHLAVVRRLSAHTLLGYRRDLDLLSVHAQAQGWSDWRALSSEALRSFIAAQHRRGLAPKSLQRLLSACRGFLRHLVRLGALKANPADALRAPKAPRKLPQVLDVDEAAAFMTLPGSKATVLRDRAMVELFYSSGLRLAELIGLIWTDLDAEAGLLRVTGKGDKTRIVPVGGPALAALAAIRGGSAPDAPIFLGRGGRHLSPRAVQARIRHWAQAQGLGKRVYPHLLRHSCASHLLESSGDLRAVQELLGHADIATTQIYTHLDFQHLAKVYDQSHPRAKRKP